MKSIFLFILFILSSISSSLSETESKKNWDQIVKSTQNKNVKKVLTK